MVSSGDHRLISRLTRCSFMHCFLAIIATRSSRLGVMFVSVYDIKAISANNVFEFLYIFRYSVFPKKSSFILYI